MPSGKSTIAVSMHKAGSSIADLILTDVFDTMGYEIDRVATKVSASPLSEPEFVAQYQPRKRREGVHYGMARHPGTHEQTILRYVLLQNT